MQCNKAFLQSVLRYDKFDSISLHLPEPNDMNTHTLNHLLNNFVKNEIISGITCEGCNKNRPPNTEPITAPAVKLLRFGKVFCNNYNVVSNLLEDVDLHFKLLPIVTCLLVYSHCEDVFS